MRARAGVTLIEMLLVVSIIGLMAGIAYPSIAAGLDTLRLNSAADSIASLFNEGLSRAERLQLAVELSISKRDRTLSLRASEPGTERTLELPQGVTVTAVAPEPPGAEESDAPRRFMLYPGGTVPRISIEIANSRNARRAVKLDPITGVPQVERLP